MAEYSIVCKDCGKVCGECELSYVPTSRVFGICEECGHMYDDDPKYQCPTLSQEDIERIMPLAYSKDEWKYVTGVGHVLIKKQ